MGGDQTEEYIGTFEGSGDVEIYGGSPYEGSSYETDYNLVVNIAEGYLDQAKLTSTPVTIETFTLYVRVA